MNFSNNSSQPLRKVSTRFDSLKSNDTDRKSSFIPRDRMNSNRRYTEHTPPQKTSSTLFSVKNTSLADYIPEDSESSGYQTYVSPHRRKQLQRNKFISEKSTSQEKNKLTISTTAFPSIGEQPAHKTSVEDTNNNRYVTALAISDEDYQTQQRKKDSMKSNNTVYQETDKLGDPQKSSSYDKEDDENRDDGSYDDPKKPVCPYQAAKAAMGMLRFHQHRRDELNDLLGGQSPYWQTKSLLDFTFDSEDDSDYHESSSEEDINNDYDDDDDY